MTTNHPLPPIDVRLRLAALWASTMLIFVYVDLFNLYRPEFREMLDQGRIWKFDFGPTFLFAATLYVIIPGLMVYCSTALAYRANRIANIVIATLYGITIIAGIPGEMGFYILGSVVEVVLLALVVVHAWTWRHPAEPTTIH